MKPDHWLIRQIATHTAHLRFWLRKLGLTVEQRRAFWLAMAAREK